MKDKIKVAFLGGSEDSAVGRAHFSAINLDGNYELSAGCFSSNSSRNKTSANFYGIQSNKIFHSPRELVAAGGDAYDYLILLTPTSLHFEHLKLAMNGGAKIICEKSMVSSLSQNIEINKELSFRSLEVPVIFNYTGYPMVREVRKKVLSGMIGKVKQIHIQMPQESFIRRNEFQVPIQPQKWRLIDGEIPTISLDLGVHIYSLIEFITGKHPIKVNSIFNSFGNFPEVIDDVQGNAIMEDGILVNFWYSKSALGNRNGLNFSIYGDDGSVFWNQENPDFYHFNDSKGTRNLVDRSSLHLVEAGESRYNRFKSGHPTGFIEALANYYQDIKFEEMESTSKSEYVLTQNNALNGMRFLSAMNDSVTKLNWVTL